MKKLLNKAPQIIKQAGRSPLGLAAEVVLLVSSVALVFFSGGPLLAQVISFLCLLGGLTFFVIAITRIYSNSGRIQSSRYKEVSAKVIPAINKQAHQAAAVCFRHRGENLEFLLILNKKGTRRIFPKGNVKEDEALWAAAEREAKEEAGVEGSIRREPFTIFWTCKGKKRPQGMAIAAFLLEVTRMTHKKKRAPMWYSPPEALDALGENQEPEVKSELRRVLRKAVVELREV